MMYRGKYYPCDVDTDEYGNIFYIYDMHMLEDIKADIESEIWPAEMDAEIFEDYMEAHQDDKVITPEVLEKMKKKYRKAVQALHRAEARIHEYSDPFDENPYIAEALEEWNNTRYSHYRMIEEYVDVIKDLER